MTFIIIPSITVFNPIYTEYKKGEEPACLSFVPDLWEFFYQESPNGVIDLKWTMELWKKIEDKVGTTNKEWLFALFGDPDNIAFESKKYDHYTSLVELAKTYAQYKNKRVLMICDNGKIKQQEHPNILVETSENFMKIVNFVKELNFDEQISSQIVDSCSLLESFLFKKDVREKVERLTSI